MVLTHVAPETKTSIVLALVKLLSAVTSTADATTTTAMRQTRLVRALRITIGTSRKTTTSHATRDRVIFWTMEAGKRDILGSREISLLGCKTMEVSRKFLGVGWWMMFLIDAAGTLPFRACDTGLSWPSSTDALDVLRYHQLVKLHPLDHAWFEDRPSLPPQDKMCHRSSFGDSRYLAFAHGRS